MEKPRPEDIKNFPQNPRARIKVNGGHVYVVEYTYFRNEKGKPSRNQVTLGMVKDGVYYPADEWRRLFTRNGALRDEERKPAKPNRKYVRKKPAGDIVRKKRPSPPDYPKPEEVENWPQVPRARVKRIGNVYYVVVSTYWREDGKQRSKQMILGRVVNSRFYTQDEYRLAFGRDGKPRQRKLRKGGA